MPISISSRLNGETTTAKPWNSALISAKARPRRSGGAGGQ
jgi:hypothetical protein